MIEENWIDVTLYMVHVNSDSKESVESFLFNSELKKIDILKILMFYYGDKFKSEEIIIDEVDYGLQLI
ncbi:hypothetical protein [Carnobacterium maltaromaticum]|uniref:hypothetical protein n=1 Tax=Carnobacterium maltaromaticum TaxID=2751 RepID=UPI00295E6D75|nr:hypothetical protein [Carnobacterium maltaromaticum]